MKSAERSLPPPADAEVRIADLFAGCGGISLGMMAAASSKGVSARVQFACELDKETASTFALNLAPKRLAVGGVESILDGRLGSRLTSTERAFRDGIGPIDLVVGGPPCQGFSDLNNHTRHIDSRNYLYTRMARAAQVLRPQTVLIENVPGVRRDKTGHVLATIRNLEQQGYRVDARTIDMSDYGVPQRRKRFVVLAFRNDWPEVDSPFDSARTEWIEHEKRTVAWAIGDLVDAHADSEFDGPSDLSTMNLARVNWLHDADAYDLPNELRPACHQKLHRYRSMYGRLRWDMPAQTITSGFGSMGQGRHVHPLRRRVLTAHEAARLQTFPDSFEFATQRRGHRAEMIGNAAPPLFNAALGQQILTALVPGG